MLDAMKALIYMAVILMALRVANASTDPFTELSPKQKALVKPVIERYVHDQITENWGDLWEISDQTPDLKNELLSGNRNAPDMTKEQFVSAMRETIGTGLPRLHSFDLLQVKVDQGNLTMVGCGYATREGWKKKGLVIAGIKIVNGRAKMDIFAMTSDTCP